MDIRSYFGGAPAKKKAKEPAGDAPAPAPAPARVKKEEPKDAAPAMKKEQVKSPYFGGDAPAKKRKPEVVDVIDSDEDDTPLSKRVKKASPQKKKAKKEPAASPQKKKAKKEPVASPQKKKAKKEPAASPQKKKAKKEPAASPQKKKAKKEPAAPPQKKKAKTKAAKEVPAASPDKGKSTPKKTKSPGERKEMSPEQMRSRASNFKRMMSRSGPAHLGERAFPDMGDSALKGLTFVISGVLEFIERDDATSRVKEFGGRVTTSVSSKTTFLVLGREPGASKLTRAKKFGTTVLDEKMFFDLLDAKAKEFPPSTGAAAAAPAPAPVTGKTAASGRVLPTSLFGGGSSTSSAPTPASAPRAPAPAPPAKKQKTAPRAAAPPAAPPAARGSTSGKAAPQLWVDKYRPRSTKECVGNASNAGKLKKWLNSWAMHGPPAVAKDNKRAWGVSPDMKAKGGKGPPLAALMSGPPGIGKTTLATLVAEECGYTTMELNASDTRSKKSLQETVVSLVDNRTMSEFFSVKGAANPHAKKKKTVLIMDEVDGMSSGDRGGVTELIRIIKYAKVPIICICNDKSKSSIRSLANHCLDLSFRRPTSSMIARRLRLICAAEGYTFTDQALERVAEGCNADIRQAINNLQIWRTKTSDLSYRDVAQKCDDAQKDVKLGPFDIYMRMTSSRGKTTLNERLNLFFMDSDIMSLMVHENYPNVTTLNQPLERLAAAADSVADSDVLNLTVRRSQAWKLMPYVGVLGCVRPLHLMGGNMRGRVNFPSWMGNNSRRNKRLRLLREASLHMALSQHSNLEQLRLEVLPAMVPRMVTPLMRGPDAIEEVISFMDEYQVTREDWDSLVELSTWNKVVPTKGIDAKTKSAFTRQYNKGSHQLVATGGKFTVASAAALAVPPADSQDAANADEEEEDSVGTDALIKMKKPRKKKAAAKKKKTPAKKKK